MIWCMWLTAKGEIDIWLANKDTIDFDAERWTDVIFFEAELMTE